MIALQVLCALCTVLCKCHFGGLKSVALSEWLADTAYDEVHDFLHTHDSKTIDLMSVLQAGSIGRERNGNCLGKKSQHCARNK